VYTKSPGSIPNYINGEGYKEFDNNYRLRALNREFQRRVAAHDPSRHDFENIIRHYIAARASIGADIGLYQRTMAGTKRKNDTVDEEELEVPQQYKRAKSNNGQAAAPQQPAAQSNLFGTSAPPATQSLVASSSNPSKATSMLNQMIPRSPQRTQNPPKASGATKPTSVSASVPNPPAGPSFIRGLLEDIENGTSMASQSAPSTTPAKPPPFVMPTPAATNGFAAFASQAAKIDKKRKAERLEDEYSSDEDSQAEGRKKLEDEERAKRVKYDSIPKTGFTPSFGVRPSVEKSTSPSKSPPKSGFTPLFGGNAQNITSPSKSSPKVKRNSPFEPDSSEEEEDNEEDHADDEETTEEKDGEFLPEDEETSQDSQEAEDEEDYLPEDDVEEDADDDDVDRQAMIDANPNKGKSLFDRIEPNPVKPAETHVNGEKSIESGFQFPKSDEPIMASPKKDGFKPGIWGAHIGKSTPDAPAFSPITPATSSPYRPATTFNFTPTPATTTPTPVPGASVLSGGLTAGSYTKFDGMFGSRPTTPNPFETEAPTPPSGPADHTWKAGSPIKFGETPEKAPKINLTAASPEKDGDTTPKPATFGSLFGTAPASTSKAGDNNLGFSFGGSKPAPDFLSASRIGAGLTPLSGLSSGLSSRGTSPGLTDAESVATDTSDNMPAEPQTSFLDSRAGEEDEECLFEARSKALKFITEEAAKTSKKLPNTWQTMGVGPLRLLKNKETGKCRILLRAEPGANIIVNANLLPTMEYSSIDQGKSGAVKGALFDAKDNKLERWVFKLKTHEMAVELEELMKANQMSPVAEEDS
jgi:RanBP1 domain